MDHINNLKIDTQKLKNNFLHINIYDSNEETSLLIKEFLFSVLIMKSYSQGEKVFYLGNEVKIVVEIPIGFYDMKEKFIYWIISSLKY